MIGKPIALLQVPNQALFSLKAAARYLGISTDTLTEFADNGLLKCYELCSRRTFKLEDLEKFRDALPEWDNRPRPMPAPATTKGSSANVQ
jgi:excisionase family DNA binding protein